MKSLKIFSTVLLCCAIATTSFSQKTKTDTFQVSGNCGMCEAKIEKAAKAAGATYAEWNKDTKVITVKYNSTSSNLAKIQKGIADAGYDNVGVKTTSEAYDKLHACCKYDRTAVATTGSEKMDCCQDGKCTKEGHDGKDCCKKDGTAKMDCCKDGKCTKEGHDGKDCCKNEEDHKH
ncbi:MAG TPA: cation transporter [Chitinophagaceae bacterium]